MNVLLLTQVLPYPPDSGPKVKTYNVLKYLAQHHKVTLVSFTRGDQSDDIHHLKPYCRAVHTIPMQRGAARDAWYVARSLLTGQPFLMIRDDRVAMRRLIDRLATEEHFDVAHADQLNMAQYAARVSGTFKVFDAHNALWLLYKRLWETMSPGPRKWLLGRDWRLLKEYEGRVCRQFDAVLAVSQEDQMALEEAARQRLDILVIPIAIDTDEVTVIERKPDPSHILHIGTMYWPPNIDGVLWFAHEVYPLIRQQRPDVCFDIVGARPPQEIAALDGDDTGIHVTGYVADPTPYLQRAALMVVPLRAGGGMRVKILNAMAQGIPIVSTTLGCEGIEVTPGWDILIGDTPEVFAAQVLSVLNDPALNEQLSSNGRRLVEEKYDYRNACCTLSDVYRRAVSKQEECSYIEAMKVSAMRDDVRIHPTADVSPEAQVGEGTSIWHQAQIREGAHIGRHCVIGKGVYVDFGVRIGNNVKIQNYVSVYHGVTIQDGVFIGPHVCFTNDKWPRAVNPDGSLKGGDDWVLSETLVLEGAAIGANSVIVCGTTIGRWAMVGSGSVVTRDVPDYGLVWGNPARLQGFVCPCGERLQEADGHRMESVLMVCPKCGTEVRIPVEVCQQIGGGR